MTTTATKSTTVVEKEGSGSLNVMLHPLVIINISDHWTRTKVQNNIENPRVVGALLGLQTGMLAGL
jgi:COP9 signalosome complex subunit 6